MISPTGNNTIRSDSKGKGFYQSSRGGRAHDGTDYVCQPGQVLVAPISGTVTRIARPYSSGPYLGLVIQGKHSRVKMFYLKPDEELVGKFVSQGDVIGVAQNISEKYGKEMIPHIHVQIESFDPELLINMV